MSTLIMKEIGPVYVVEGQDKNYPPVVATVVQEGSLYWVHTNREEFPGLGGWLDKAYSEPVTMSRATQELFYAYRKWIEVERLVSD